MSAAPKCKSVGSHILLESSGLDTLTIEQARRLVVHIEKAIKSAQKWQEKGAQLSWEVEAELKKEGHHGSQS